MVDSGIAMTPRGALLLLSLTHGVDHLIQLALPIAILVSPFSVLEQSILLTVMLFMFGLGGLPAGWLSDKMDSRLVILTYLVCSSIGMFLASFTTEFLFSLIAQIVIGFGISLYHPAGTALVTRLYPAGQRGHAMGIHGSVGNSIQASAPFIASMLFFTFGWKLGYLALSVPTLIFVIVFTIWWKKQPLLGTSVNEMQAENEPLNESSRPFRTTLFTKAVVLALFISMLRGLSYQGTLAWLPTFFANTQTYEESVLIAPILSAGVKTTLMLLPGMVAQIIGGTISDRKGWYLPLAVSCILSAISLFLLPFLPTVALPVISAAVFGFAFFAAQSVENALLADVTPREHRGSAFGISFFIRFGIGSLAAGIGGIIILTFDIVWVFPAMGIIALLTLPFILLLRAIGIKMHD
ncbi:MAG: MFS transporter [Candidatus Ranarchaeia archaeon]